LIWCANLLHGGSLQTDRTRTRWSQVTHYYFQDCVYYTPAFSDEPLGRLALRQITDAASGERVPNIYLGEEVRAPEPEQIPKRGWGPFRRRLEQQGNGHSVTIMRPKGGRA
jgi:hypothetical protein